MSNLGRKAQIYLPEEQYRAAMRLAKGKHTSFAQVVREALWLFLRKNKSRWDEDPITAHLGAFEGKDSDLSTSHDRHIYE